MPATSELGLHPDRLLPSEPALRSLAQQLYDSVTDLPIISPHGHVPAHRLADDIAFHDPTSLLITPDHYVNRMLHAHGVELSALGVGQGALSEEASRNAFRILCSHWSAYRGTPVRFWLDAQLGEIFGVTERPSAETADQIYDRIAGCIASPEFKPRALYEQFKIEVLATTDDPCDDLAAHQFLRDDETCVFRLAMLARGSEPRPAAVGSATQASTGSGGMPNQQHLSKFGREMSWQT